MGRNRRGVHVTLALVAFGALASIGCGATATSPSPTGPSAETPTQTQRLRLVNEGPSPASALVVMFPNTVRVSFGDVAAGATTSYTGVPGGVYRYAAYQLTIDGVTIDQPVIDWVGETPMAGIAFTYRIDVDTSRPRGQIIRLLSATRDQ